MTDMMMIAAGLALLYFGGEWLIKGAVSLAHNFGLSKLLVSAVIIGFGTSMPEMTVSVSAALKGSPDISVGNVVGSNIANVLLIIGIASVICPITIDRLAAWRDTLAMIGSSLVLCALSLMGIVDFVAGLLMLIALLAYIFWTYSMDKQQQMLSAEHVQQDIEGDARMKTALAAVFSIGGLVVLVGGAWLMVEGAVSLARGFGTSEAVIGLTVVAVGTSLPELATAFVAARRGHSDVIIGNVLGSNIFNILAILGVTAMVVPIPMPAQIASTDVWLMLGVTLFFSIYLLRGQTIGRVSGIAMLLAYSGYTAWLYLAGGI